MRDQQKAIVLHDKLIECYKRAKTDSEMATHMDAIVVFINKILESKFQWYEEIAEAIVDGWMK